MSKNPFQSKEKKFSVITPVFKENYRFFSKFFQCLDQSDYKTFEVIISFDGKNLKGEKELARMRKLYPEMDIKFVINEWGGAPSARNHGAKVATGDYFTFLDPDIYVYTDTLRAWANAFENDSNKDVIWGLYDVISGQDKMTVGGYMPCDAKDNPIYYAFRFSNYCSGAFPMRKEAFVEWDNLKSLQDWDMWIRMLKKDNFEGSKFKFIRKSFFLTEAPRESGLSDDSHKNWKERVKEVKNKNGIKECEVCVTSLGAPFHGVNVAKMLGYDYLPMPSYKPNDYKTIYLLGFYPSALEGHFGVFATDQKVKKIVHWIGTDIYQLGHNISVTTWKELVDWFKKEKVISLCEADFTQKELKDLNIDAKIVPIPPQKIYKPIPLPDKFTVGIYENSTQNMYAEEMMAHVARSMPDIEFKLFGDETKKGKYGNVEHLGWVNMDEWLPKLSCNLRVTTHDGLSLTVLQFLTAGRQVVINTPVKGTIKCDYTRQSIVRSLRKAQKQTLDLKWSKYWQDEVSISKFKEDICKII